MAKSPSQTILSSFLFRASPDNMERTIFAVENRDDSARSFRLLRAVWKHRRAAHTLLVIGVIPQMWVAVAQKHLPGCNLRVLITECLWQRDPDNLKGKLKSRLMRWMIRRLDVCILYSTADIPRFAKYFQAPQSKFTAIRFHTTLRPERYPTVPVDGNYIFAGGNSDRDYRSLVEAMRSIDALCLIACGTAGLSGIQLPSNVCRVDANPLQFRQLMAGAAVVVLPMRHGLLRSAGQQTFLNAMKLGKVVIVTDTAGAADYINNGKSGILCAPDELASVVRHYLGNPTAAAEIGKMAQKAGDAYNVESTYDSICRIADELAARDHRGRGGNLVQKSGGDCAPLKEEFGSNVQLSGELRDT